MADATDDDLAKLVARLRHWEEVARNAGLLMYAQADMLRAADALEAQAREIAALTENFDALMIKAQEAVDGQAAALLEVVALKAENAALTARAEAAEAKVGPILQSWLAFDEGHDNGPMSYSDMRLATEALLREIGGGNG